MSRITTFALCALVLGVGSVASAQTLDVVPQTQSQNQVQMPAPTARTTPQAPARSQGNMMEIAPATNPTPTAPQQAAPAPQYPDPAVAAAAAAAAAVNALMMAQPIQTPGSPPPAAAPPPAPLAPSLATQSVPSLPPVFRGCWQGEVDLVDDLEALPGAHRIGYWTPKTYRLCYKRVGSGPFHLTFTQAGIVPNEQIIHPRGHVDAIATDGRAYAKLRSDLHFDEYHVDHGMRGDTFAVDEQAMLDCRINGDEMAVTAGVYGTRDGEPWFRARWHADFRHIPD